MKLDILNTAIANLETEISQLDDYIHGAALLEDYATECELMLKREALRHTLRNTQAQLVSEKYEAVFANLRQAIPDRTNSVIQEHRRRKWLARKNGFKTFAMQPDTAR